MLRRNMKIFDTMMQCGYNGLMNKQDGLVGRDNP
jgi:hypothetical protein